MGNACCHGDESQRKVPAPGPGASAGAGGAGPADAGASAAPGPDPLRLRAALEAWGARGGARSRPPEPTGPEGLPTARLAALRSFGRVVGGVLLALGAFSAWRRGGPSPASPWTWVGLLGLWLVLAGQFAPARLDRLDRLWMRLGHLLGGLVTRVLLSLVFFLMVTPQGLLMRLLGSDRLRLTRDPQRDSLFDPPPEHLRNPKHFEKPF